MPAAYGHGELSLIPDPRGSNLKMVLAQREARWIHVTPSGPNDVLSFDPFL